MINQGQCHIGFVSVFCFRPLRKASKTQSTARLDTTYRVIRVGSYEKKTDGQSRKGLVSRLVKAASPRIPSVWFPRAPAQLGIVSDLP